MSLTAGSSSTISMLGIYARFRQLDLDRGPYPFSREQIEMLPPSAR